jgi:hypothetical protein
MIVVLVDTPQLEPGAMVCMILDPPTEGGRDYEEDNTGYCTVEISDCSVGDTRYSTAGTRYCRVDDSGYPTVGAGLCSGAREYGVDGTEYPTVGDRDYSVDEIRFPAVRARDSVMNRVSMSPFIYEVCSTVYDVRLSV